MIHFYTDGASQPIENQAEIEKWVRVVVAVEARELGVLNYIFCSDERILAVNKQYLDHDYYTDIITFDYSKNQQISGDIFISIDTVRSNAEELAIDFLEELHRVMIHGVLHLCGWGDEREEEQIIMRSKENEALNQLSQL